MKKSSYGEHDYAFGQRMLTLRTSIGLTQAGLARQLGISRQAVVEWEAGGSYPKAEHLKQFLALCMQQQAFAAGQEAEEIRALWREAHQKVLLDECWLQGLLSQQASPLVEGSFEQPYGADRVSVSQALGEPRVDWGEALDVPRFYGREEELALLSRWVAQERCRVVSVLGIGGIGKSALAVTLMHRVAAHFEVVIWRSLRDAPGCSALLDECLQVLAPQPLRDLSDSLEGRLRLLMERMRERRVLLVLDNLEMLLEEGEGMGRMRAGSEGYARLLQQIGETAHQSCLLLTSREKPADLVPLEGRRSPVRALRLARLDGRAGAQVLAEQDVVGSLHDRVRLVEAYRGNPLALKIVAQTIVELFGGEIVLFLEQGEVVFGGVRELLDEQFARLSALEQSVFSWLAILREPVSLEELLAVLSVPRTPVQVLEALDGLGRRSLIERGQRAGSFTLQSVVLEYATARLITEASGEIERGRLAHLIEYGLCHAQAKEYVRAIQEHLLVVPLLTRLLNTSQGHANLEARLLWLLDDLRGLPQTSQGYGPANVLSLLLMLRGDLHGLDLSRLALRGVSMQGVEMQDTTLSGAALQGCVFTEPFDAIAVVTTSKSGQYWAAGSRQGEVWIWTRAGQILHQVWQAHIATVRALAFSPDGHQLASVSRDKTLKLWDVASGTLLWTGWQTKGIRSLAFSPDGHLLASGGDDTLVQLWDPQSGTKVQRLSSQGGAVHSLAWSPDGRLLAGGCSDGSIWVWQPEVPEPDTHVWRLSGHTQWVRGLAFAPDGTELASGSWDQTIKLWDMESLSCLQTFSEHTDKVHSVAWSPDGMRLDSGGGGREGGELFVWEAHSGERLQALEEHPGVAFAVVWSSSGELLVSGGSDGRLRWWEVDSGHCVRVQEAHQGTVQALKASPDGNILASCGDDGAILLWDLHGGEPLQTLRRDRPYERLNITDIRGLSAAQKASLRALGAFEETSVGG